MSSQQEYINQLIETDNKISLSDFFKQIHQRFYPEQDIFFMEYFLELTIHEGEFVVHHNKLIEYGIMSSIRSSDVKKKLDALGLVENEDYLVRDISQPVKQGGYSTKKIYMLTPEAFKKCLMRAQRRPKQTIDPVKYCNYYLLLEKTYKMYTDYEKKLLNKQIEKQEQNLEQKDQQIEKQTLQIEKQEQDLEEQRRYTLDLQEGLLGNIPELERTQIVYIATSHNYAKRNLFKVGGIEHEDKIVSRLCTYNTGRAAGDDFFYTNIYKVHDYREVESRLKKLMGGFRDRKQKEMYRLCYNNLTYILGYIVDHFNDEVDEVNKALETFINNLNKYNKYEQPVPVVPLILAQIHVHEKSDVVLTADTSENLLQKMIEYVDKLDKNIKVVKAKQVFDTIGVKEGRRLKYEMLRDIINEKLPDAKMIRF